MKKAVFIALIFVLTLYLGIFAYAEDNHSPLSPGLSVIANDSGMAKSGLCGKDLVFNTDDFLRALNLSEISYITVNSLPSANEGRLLLGTTAVSAGQKISRANLSLLVFVPSTVKETESCFSFFVEDRGYEINCSVYMLKNVNLTPYSAHPSDVSLSVNAYTGGSTFGKLAGYDPDGDTLCFEIIQYPKSGLLILNDSEMGTYTYYPKMGFKGNDSFSYVVKDKYGNYSESRAVILSIASDSSACVYTDMSGRMEYGSAVAMREAGIMFGTSSVTFDPDGYVSREDILVMAMKAAGIGDLPKVTSTVFSDDRDISIKAKPYVAAAYQLDYISGEDNGSGEILFNPKENINRAEAAQLIDRIIGGSAIVGSVSARPVFGDMNEIPASAWSALSNLHVLGLIDDTDGSINASAPLTRADAAVMLDGVMKLSGSK